MLLRITFVTLLSLAFILLAPSPVSAQQKLSNSDKKIITDFELRTRRYVQLREKLRNKLPKVSKDASPAEIEAHKAALLKSVRALRVNAKQGNLYTQSATPVIRKIIKTEFKGYEGAEIRQAVLEADTKGIPIKVNAVYPDSKELVEMSPVLLLTLPQLPKELRYRYVGRSLMILDRDTGLILDYMKDALP